MPFSTTYRRLFELRIIHGYYLKDIEEFLESPDIQSTVIESSGYSIRGDFEIQPTSGCKKLLDGHRMVFKITDLGIIIWIEAERREGEQGYRPIISIEAGTAFEFKIRFKNPYLQNLSLLRLQPNVQAQYYFNNWLPVAPLIYPSLALPPQQFSEGRQYEMGEIVKNDSVFISKEQAVGTLPFNNNEKWEPIDDLSYISYRDQQLLPKQFWYYFNPIEGNIIENPIFTLWSEGTEVKQEGVSGTLPGKKYFLDYTDVEEGYYRLEVSDGNGYQDQKQIILREQYGNRDNWGLVSIGQASAANVIDYPHLADFRLIIDGGLLPPQHPVFELRMKNRETYWRYRLHPKDQNEVGVVSSSEFGPLNAGVFVSSHPIPLSRFQGSPAVMVDNQNIDLPTPNNPTIKPAGNRIYSDIFLQKLNL